MQEYKYILNSQKAHHWLLSLGTNTVRHVSFWKIEDDSKRS